VVVAVAVDVVVVDVVVVVVGVVVVKKELSRDIGKVELTLLFEKQHGKSNFQGVSGVAMENYMTHWHFLIWILFD